MGVTWISVALEGKESKVSIPCSGLDGGGSSRMRRQNDSRTKQLLTIRVNRFRRWTQPMRKCSFEFVETAMPSSMQKERTFGSSVFWFCDQAPAWFIVSAENKHWPNFMWMFVLLPKKDPAPIQPLTARHSALIHTGFRKASLLVPRWCPLIFLTTTDTSCWRRLWVNFSSRAWWVVMSWLLGKISMCHFLICMQLQVCTRMQKSSTESSEDIKICWNRSHQWRQWLSWEASSKSHLREMRIHKIYSVSFCWRTRLIVFMLVRHPVICSVSSAFFLVGSYLYQVGTLIWAWISRWLVTRKAELLSSLVFWVCWAPPFQLLVPGTTGGKPFQLLVAHDAMAVYF